MTFAVSLISRGEKFSKSLGAAVDVPYLLSKCDPDALRFYLTAVAPEIRDTEFPWEDFVQRNNPVQSANEGPIGQGFEGTHSRRRL